MHTKLLVAAGVTPGYDPDRNLELFLEAIADPAVLKKVKKVQKAIAQPFIRFFYYGTNVGEVFEEIVGRKFTDIIPKVRSVPRSNGRGQRLERNPVYTDYYREHGLKPSNFDWLFTDTTGAIRRLEVKVIRAIEGKEKEDNGEKLYQIQTPQWERALSSSQGSGGNGTFQQTKPEFFDYVMGIVVYTDKVDFFVVPASDINREENIVPAVEIDPETGRRSRGISGHLILKPQHGKAEKNTNGTYKEGHLVLSQLGPEYCKLSVSSETELLTKARLSELL